MFSLFCRTKPAASEKPREEVVHHPFLGDILVVRSLWTRRISLSVRPSGAIRIAYPACVSQERALAFLESRVEWIAAARRRMAERAAARPEQPTLTPEEESARREALRHEAKATLPGRVAELAAQTGLSYRSVTIRATRSKWGSCNSRNDLSLSLYLMTLPPHLRDFVILHELCHTVHHNHSPRFHALLDRLVGGKEKLLNKELRSYRAG